jgi:hypothetical protein
MDIALVACLAVLVPISVNMSITSNKNKKTFDRKYMHSSFRSSDETSLGSLCMWRNLRKDRIAFRRRVDVLVSSRIGQCPVTMFTKLPQKNATPFTRLRSRKQG